MTQEKLKSILHYDMATGVFTWKISPARNVFIGSEAGSLNDAGYICIRYKGQGYLAHNLAWLYVYGEWILFLDHKDTVRKHNAIFNLRKANQSYNGANRKIGSNNKTGFKGVHVNRHGTYEAGIKCNGKRIYLGTFPTAESAHEAYCKKAIELFGSFHRESIANAP